MPADEIISNDYIIYRAYTGGNCNLIHEGRVYNLKHTNMQDKLWVCRRVKKGCRGSIHTNLDVDAILDCNPHADDCIPDNDILYKMEKKTVLKRRAAEEMKTVPQIFYEEASSASADLETASQFPTYKSETGAKISETRQQLEIPPQWRMTKSDRLLIFCTEENLSVLSEHSVWSMDGTFKIVPEWYQQMFTIHVFIAGKLVPLVYCLTVHKDLSTYRRVYNLKHTNMQDKLWVCRRVKKGCRGSIHTNLDVDAILDCNPHADDCIPDNDILYKMEKKTVLKRRAAEEMKTVPQIFYEEASSASADLETASQFPTYKSVKTAMYRKRAQKFPRLPPTRQQLEIPPQWRMTKSDRRRDIFY
ncbi:hypothetical protein T12_15200 [Trichinella patagoniensis]|uniref:FLYWCH-type domain-containing protein n=1 Tax=Trichinella patagoniensis TaxID=990121 RepID=A0A0V0ZUF7_9BILA|nr:hypothetical protein T12_15200 [Trichinella patagoniensis]